MPLMSAREWFTWDTSARVSRAAASAFWTMVFILPAAAPQSSGPRGAMWPRSRASPYMRLYMLPRLL